MQIYAGSNACSSMGAPRTPRRESERAGAALAVFWRWRIKNGALQQTALRRVFESSAARSPARAAHARCVCGRERRERALCWRAAATRPALPTELGRPD